MLQKLKKILLIAGNYYPEKTGIGRYNGEMMAWLSKNGYDCTVITSYPYYPQWKVEQKYRMKRYWFCKEMDGLVKVYRCPLYVPAKPSGLKRLLLEFSFSISAFFNLIYFIFTCKFDVILTVAPPFQLGFLGLLYRFFRKGKVIYHIQDLQIEAARDLAMIKSKRLINFLFNIEYYLLKNADLVSSISAGMITRIKHKFNRHIFKFPNWTNTDHIFPIIETEGLKELFGFKAEEKIFLYSGAIGEKQGLEIILEVASRLVKHNYKFLICGSGPYKAELQNKTSELGLKNVVFAPLQPNEKFNALLNMADVHLIIQKADAGDLVMPSKLTNILAVGGLSIVTANSGTNLYDEVVNNKIGIVINAEESDLLLKTIQTIFDNPDRNLVIRKNALQYAITNININNVLNSYFAIIDNL